MQQTAPPQSGLVEGHTLRRLGGSQFVSLGNEAGPLLSVCSLAAAAAGLHVRSVYIVPDSHVAVTGQSPGFWQPEAGWTVRGLNFSRGVPTAAQVRPAVGPAVAVIDLARDTRWVALRDMDAAGIAAALTYLEDVLGLPPAYSPGHTGRVLLDATVSRPLWLRPLSKRMPPLQAVDMSWVAPARSLGDAVWVADVNAAYLAVAADQDFGAGDPVSSTNYPLEAVKDYGFFQITATADKSPWDGRGLPSPFGPGHQRIVDGWWAAPHVRAARDLGWHVQISRALTWPEGVRHRLMRPWAQRLWQGREALAADRQRYPDLTAARAAIGFQKMLYAQTIALMAREPEDVGEPEEAAFAKLGRRRFVRPDWRAWIMAECYRRRLWEVRKLHEAGQTPLAADVDMLILPSSAANGGLLRWGGLGGYKLAGVLDDPAALALLGQRSERSGAKRWVEAIKGASHAVPS